MLRNSVLATVLFVMHGCVLGMDAQKAERKEKIKTKCEKACADLIDGSVDSAEFYFSQGIVVTMKKVVNKPFADIDKKCAEDEKANIALAKSSAFLAAYQLSLAVTMTPSSSVSHGVATGDVSGSLSTVQQKPVDSVKKVSDESKQNWAVPVSRCNNDSPHIVVGDLTSACACQGDVMANSCCCIQ